jgi:hypothetical protein
MFDGDIRILRYFISINVFSRSKSKSREDVESSLACLRGRDAARTGRH